MPEIWKSIQGYEGLYEVSNLGNVRSLDRVIKSKHNGTTVRKGRILTPFYEEKKGYYQVRLSKDGKNKTFRVHRLVALAFLENPFNYTDINHKDEVKTNNNVDNLEWCTRKYNNNYGTKPERIRKAMMGNTNGSKSWFTIGKRGCRMLILPIKKKWFDMILSGEKKEEYREIKPYYDTRFRNVWGYPAYWCEHHIICLRNGYSKTAPCIYVDATLRKGEGKPEWGAEPNKKYFVLTIREIVKEVTDGEKQ